MKEFPFDINTYGGGALTPEELLELENVCQRMQLDRGDWLLTQGQRCHHAFFVLRGLMRQYSLDNRGREHTLFFAAEGEFLTNVEAICLQKPSSYFIQCIEQAEVLLVGATDLDELSRRMPSFGELRLKLLHEHIQHQQKRITQLQAASAEERYLTFIADYPQMLLRVPQHYIASYLGITPESLSRIRKSLAEKRSS